MKKVQRLFSLLFSLLSLTSQHALAETEASGDRRFYYQGKEVSKAYFDAINMAKDADPLVKAGKYVEAEAMLAKALETVSDDADVCLHYAVLLGKMGKVKDSIVYYEKASLLDPNSEACFINWSAAYGALGQLDESLRISREFLKRFPKSAMFSQMQNQANTIEKELKRHPIVSKKESEDYLSEACPGPLRRWNSKQMPLPVFIQSGTGVEKWRPAFEAIMRQAFEEWAEASGKTLSFKFVPDKSEAKIQVAWLSDTKSLKNPSELGQADTKYADNGELMQATIKMLTVSPLDPKADLTDAGFRKTALHEVGHALGIYGHSSNPEDALYFASMNVYEPKLSKRDAATIRKLYSGR